MAIVVLVTACGEAAPASPSLELDRLPWFQAETREANDIVSEATLRIGLADGTTTATIPLPFNRDQALPPAGIGFISGPANGAVLFSLDDGDRSKVQLVDVATGDSLVIFESDQPILAGAVHPSGSPLYLVTADRSSDPMRINARLVELPIANDRTVGEPVARQWLGDAPMERTELFGLFHFTPDGARLVIPRCLEGQCSYFVVSLSDGSVLEHRAAGGGEIVGISNDALIVHPANWGMTKEFQQVPIADGLPPMGLTGQAATIVSTEAGPLIVLDRGQPGSGDYVVVDPRSGQERRLETPRDLRGSLVSEPERQGLRPPPGWAVFAAEGRISRAGTPIPLTLIHVLTGRTVEVPSLE